MNIKLARLLRFSILGKIIFNVRCLDYIFRRLFLNHFTEQYYSDTTLNWKHINEKLNPILKKYNCFLGHGGALLLIRDKKIKFNQDLDYDIFEMESYDGFLNDMQKKGFVLVSKSYNQDRLIMFTFRYETAYIDFFVIYKHKDHWAMETCCYEKVLNHFVKYNDNFYRSDKCVSYKRIIKNKPEIGLFEFENIKVYLPKNHNEYFIDLYGSDWTIPKRYYNWAINPKENKPKKIKKNIIQFLNKEQLAKMFY